MALRARLAVMFGQRSHHPAVVFDRLTGPARDGGKNGFRRITGDLRHHLRKLWRLGSHIDGPMELMVEPHRSLDIVARVRFLELSLDFFEFAQLVVVDVDRGSRGEFAAHVRLQIGDVGEIASGDRQHHEAATRLLGQQPLGA